MRRSFTVTVAALALMTAGCGKLREAPDDSSSGPATSRQDVGSAERSSSGSTPPGETTMPDINPDAAPNLAFGYTYRFGLAADRIAEVQQGHARMCEELGSERCQITGMTFRRVGERDAQAALAIGIEPGLAHRFGEQALANVRGADGQLIDNEVTGSDVGEHIRGTERTLAEVQAELDDILARASATNSPALRQTLQAEAARLRERIQALRGTRGVAQERRAMTTISISYGSGAYAGSGPDFGGAVATAWDRVKWIAYSLFVLLLSIGPWVMGGALLWWGAYRIQRKVKVPTD